MSTTTSTTTAERNGAAWGARARDWGDTEAQQIPTYEEAIRRTGIGPGRTVLDIGCGTGVFLRAAAAGGATVYGIDASEALLAIARERVPDADLSLGDLQRLPYADDCFDVVCGFNAFFYADDMVAALREAGRVAKPGAPVVIQVFGRPEYFDLRLMKEVLARFTPPPPERSGGEAAGRDSGRLNPFTLWEPGVLEELAVEVGLVPERAFDLRWAYEYADEAELTRGMMSAGGFGAIVGGDRQDAARAAIVDALAGCRTAEGSYRLDNEWHYLIARAGS